MVAMSAMPSACLMRFTSLLLSVDMLAGRGNQVLCKKPCACHVICHVICRVLC